MSYVAYYLHPTPTKAERSQKFPNSLLNSNPSCLHSKESFLVLKDKQLFFDIIMQPFTFTVPWVYEMIKIFKRPLFNPQIITEPRY